MPDVDLTGLDWQLRGWRPFQWVMAKSMETGGDLLAELGPFPARVPGSVQQALLNAGVIEDWHIGVNSRACEWVEHRQWEFSAAMPAGTVPQGERVVLDAQGLDYSGWILVDGKKVARFEGTLIPHRFDLTEALSDGNEHLLSLVFDEPPREQGQLGYTSQSRWFKPRYPYSWDWCPRVVPVGVWDTLVLQCGAAGALDLAYVRATLAQDNATGRVELAIDLDEAIGAKTSIGPITAVLRDGQHEIGHASANAGPGHTEMSLDALPITPWWPNGHGEAKTYSLDIEAAVGNDVWRQRRTLGFRRVEWLPCDDAPEGAEPWICTVNGKPIFLQGVNWVPPRVCYHDTTEAEYRCLIDLYRDMGCTILRVWGGGILERELFYSLCDEAGILVWQEFPLSSSGVDNWPPEDPAVIKRLTAIASSYIRRRGHHASLLLWCGGNELLGGGPEGPGQDGVPVGYDHPCIAAMRDVVETQDPGRRFLPTSASGPWEWGTREKFGSGQLHDVHGPWGFGAGCDDLDAWRAYWSEDDALFRSEVGMPGAHDLDMLRYYSHGADTWPPTTEYWLHTSSWWRQWDRFKDRLADLPPEDAMAEYVKLTQADQAEAYAIAATACKERFPRCGGFVIWMGHDCFPCPANNSVIDFGRRPKPAYFALKEVFAGPSR
jgi:beta-mannosidase